MRLLVLFLIIALTTNAQKEERYYQRVEKEIVKSLKLAAHPDSLEYKDSTCSYARKGEPYTGYVVHFHDEKYHFDLFENGYFNGVKLIYNKLPDTSIIDSARAWLYSIRFKTDTNIHRMHVRTFYDFPKRQVYEDFIDYRYECAQVEESEAFDVIFGGDPLRPFPYKSYYPNGNLMEHSKNNLPNRKWLKTYYEDGKKELVEIFDNNTGLWMRKRWTESGKCTYRIVIKKDKVRRGFMITNEGEKYRAWQHRRDERRKKKASQENDN